MPNDPISCWVVTSQPKFPGNLLSLPVSMDPEKAIMSVYVRQLTAQYAEHLFTIKTSTISPANLDPLLEYKPKVATKKGDLGRTSLWSGEFVSKAHPRIEAMGWGQRLNVALGRVKRQTQQTPFLRAPIPWEHLQHTLMLVMSEIAQTKPIDLLKETHLRELDTLMILCEGQIGDWNGWSVPGASELTLSVDEACAIARQFEVAVCKVYPEGNTPLALQYINRLSDVLWAFGRIVGEKEAAIKLRNL